jgi:CubicO group peptidase (beta-lactamase class C family)
MAFTGKLYAQNLSNENVARYMKEARKKYNIPAMAVTAFNSDSIFVKEIQGVRVVSSDDAAQPGDYFHIGSCSKSILSVIVGKMVEEGTLSWKTKFFDIYPELKNLARQEYHDITLEDLLSCRAGIQSFTSYNDLSGVDAKSLSSRHEFIKYLIQQAPSSQPTDISFDHLYSNPSYTMAAAMLERITGLTWEELIRKMLKRELGLSVVFGWPNVFDQDQPWGHTKITDEPYDDWLKLHGTRPERHSLPNKNVLLAFAPDHEFKLPDIIAPAGDLSMKPLDFAKYAQLHL